MAAGDEFNDGDDDSFLAGTTAAGGGDGVDAVEDAEATETDDRAAAGAAAEAAATGVGPAVAEARAAGTAGCGRGLGTLAGALSCTDSTVKLVAVFAGTDGTGRPEDRAIAEGVD